MSADAVKGLKDYVNAIIAVKMSNDSMLSLDKHITPSPDDYLDECRCIEHLLIEFDKINTSHEFTGKLGHCYQYAYRTQSIGENLVYCEGYAVGKGVPIPLLHAWCVDNTHHTVIDPVWRKKRAGIAYLGLPFNMSFVNTVMLSSGVYGVIDSLFYTVRKIKKFKLEEVVHEDFHELVFAKRA